MCTAPGARKIVIRDEQTGEEIWEKTLKMEIENLWVGDSIVVTVPKNFEHGNTICMVHVL